jgi:D-arabinose 1-dehydrogenase-like Zn-dependent alcohol dehydrogenase
MTVSAQAGTILAADPAGMANGVWPFRGGGVSDLGVDGQPVETPLLRASADQIVARVDAVGICSSDVKIMRMGSRHPLLSQRDLARYPLVLGHELALTVWDVGKDWGGVYKAGQRLGLQPAIIRDGQRTTIGIDLPGGFAQFITLDDHVLGGDEPYVFAVPDDVSAAAVALLEPYACVEAAYRPNCRTTLLADGRLLVVGTPASASMTMHLDVGIAEAVLLSPPPAIADWAVAHAGQVRTVADLAGLAEGVFDDILLLGSFEPGLIEALLPRLADRGMLTIVSPDATGEAVTVDPARIHYKEISIVGCSGPRVEEAFGISRNRFDLSPGGTTLILGAGGAMGRIHLHRALGMREGPRRIIATSRTSARVEALRRDFGPLAEREGRELALVLDHELDACMATLAPAGCDDVVVVVPDVASVERGATFMRPSGMLVIFAGMPFGSACRLPIGGVAAFGARFTGSTGCTVADQKAVLARVIDGSLDLSCNLESVAGFGSLPEAVALVEAGYVCGKIVVFPALPALKLTAVAALTEGMPREAARWTLADERSLADSGNRNQD